MPDITHSPLEEFAGEEARLLACVHCGFCLDACPTYTRLGLESDSPRGRLYLMRAVAEGRVPADAEALEIHLDRCLGCRACEPVCPSGVQYGYLLERGRAIVARNRGTDATTRRLLDTFGRRGRTRVVMALARLLRGSGMAALLARALPARFHRTRFALAMLAASRPWKRLTDVPAPPPPVAPDAESTISAVPGAQSATPRESYVRVPRAAPAVPRAAVLSGCVQAGLFARVNQATVQVLEANGCTIVPVPAQGCCGALHAHGGDLAGARALAQVNIDAFERAGAEVVVVNAAGCGAAMKEYGELFEGTPEHRKAKAFAAKVRDIAEFLVELGPRTGGGMKLRVAFDSPCHLLHAQRIERAPHQMLAAIPGLDVVTIPHADECCGGAGTYGLTHPDLGGRILADKLNNVLSAHADAVVTPNPGCMMQIGAGLLIKGDATPVLHPVELLAESYRRLEQSPSSSAAAFSAAHPLPAG